MDILPCSEGRDGSYRACARSIPHYSTATYDMEIDAHAELQLRQAEREIARLIDKLRSAGDKAQAARVQAAEHEGGARASPGRGWFRKTLGRRYPVFDIIPILSHPVVAPPTGYW